ncbi:MAG: hypothetical protein ACK5MT_19365 [Actinomycetales bacterium]
MHDLTDIRVLCRAAAQHPLAELTDDRDPATADWAGKALLALCFALVFARHTGAVEAAHGHRARLGSLPERCHDQFLDDVEAVNDYARRHARYPIDNLAGWIVSRIPGAVVDGHRRRRARVGALQRPRMTVWLERGLDHDPWLCRLALLILEWVGTPTPAGTQPWPYAAWTQRRADIGFEYALPAAHHRVQDDVETVLAAMRSRPQWYRAHVERPLEHKHLALSRHPFTVETTATQIVDRTHHVPADQELHAIAAEVLEQAGPWLASPRAGRRIAATLVRAGLPSNRDSNARAYQRSLLARALGDPDTLSRAVREIQGSRPALRPGADRATA